MTTSIVKIAREEVKELISLLAASTVSRDDVVVMEAWLAASESVWMGSFGGRLLCVWGLIPPTLLSDQAYLWLLTTPDADEHQFVLVRRGQIELKKMLETYPQIIGHCEVSAPRSIRWLKWLGAKFGERDGALIPFVIRKET